MSEHLKIALYDMDRTGFPNLALCKLAAHYRALGNTVAFNPNREEFKPDLELGSRVFSWNPPIPKGVKTGKCLEENIEHTCPDTSDYNVNSNWAYGFTSRGCIRKCEFCQVWRTEGKIKAWSHPSEFVMPHHDRLIMLDNNWLASPNFEETATWIADRKIKIDPTQGLDIRLVNESNASILGRVKFTLVKFAFDSMDYVDQLIRGVQLLRHWRVKPARYQAYCIHYPNDDILERIKILEGLYVDPFVMPYIALDGTRKSSDIARWANAKQIYRGTPWELYNKNIKKKVLDNS